VALVTIDIGANDIPRAFNNALGTLHVP